MVDGAASRNPYRREFKPLVAPRVQTPGDKILYQFFQFGWFPDPSDQYELYHTPSYPKIWDFAKEKNVNHPFNMASWMTFGSLLSRWYWGVEKFFVKVESFDVFIQECKISSIDFCTECQNFTIQSQPNGGEIWMSSNFLEQKKDDNRLFKIS